MNKTYLGDSVYAEFDGRAVNLTTENGIETTNTIYLDLCTLNKLQKYIAQCLKQLDETQ